jgi:hypothetical protein
LKVSLIFISTGADDDHWTGHFGHNLAGSFKTVHFGHKYIHGNYIRLETLGQAHCLRPISSRADNLQIRRVLQNGD